MRIMLFFLLIMVRKFQCLLLRMSAIDYATVSSLVTLEITWGSSLKVFRFLQLCIHGYQFLKLEPVVHLAVLVSVLPLLGSDDLVYWLNYHHDKQTFGFELHALICFTHFILSSYGLDLPLWWSWNGLVTYFTCREFVCQSNRCALVSHQCCKNL